MKATTTDIPDAVIAWTSSDESVATVDANGLVTALAEGSATITAACNGLQASASVKVNPKPVILNPTIAISPLSIELTEGETFALKATTTDIPDAVIVWTSSDESVATVGANGLVTALSEGSATITAACNGLQASASVKVNPKPVVLNPTIAISPLSIELTEGETFALKATTTDIPDAVIVWTSSDETVATVDANGLVTALAEGSATITAACNGLQASASVKVKAQPTIEDGLTTIIENETIEIFTLKGVKILANPSDLPKGIYIIRQGTKTQKTVIR